MQMAKDNLLLCLLYDYSKLWKKSDLIFWIFQKNNHRDKKPFQVLLAFCGRSLRIIQIRAELIVSPVLISVPLEGGRWDCHGFTAQDGRLSQMGWHVLHVCDHGRVWQGNRGMKEWTNRNRREFSNQYKSALTGESSQISLVSAHKAGKPPGESNIKMYEFIHNYASTVFTDTIHTPLCYNPGAS